MLNKSIQIFIVNYYTVDEINKNIKLIFKNNNINLLNLKITIIDNSGDFVLFDERFRAHITIRCQNNGINENRYGKGSLDHSMSLNKYINELAFDDQIVVILDPDCYLYGSEWIEKFSKVCDRKGKCIATPWHPKHEAKLDGSVAVHFVMYRFDSKIYYDFRPNFDNVSIIRTNLTMAKRKKYQTVRLFLRAVKRILFWGTSKDTGYKIRECFSEINWFVPFVKQNQVFWINDNGTVSKKYSLILKIFRNIDITKKDYVFDKNLQMPGEVFAYRDVLLQHDRRTDSTSL